MCLQAKDERNYHIFYEMLAGLPTHMKQAFYLQEAETYYYLNQVNRGIYQDTPSTSTQSNYFHHFPHEMIQAQLLKFF